MQESRTSTQTNQILICILTKSPGDSCAYKNLRKTALASLSSYYGVEKNCHAWGKPLPKNCVLPQHAGVYRVRWLWGLGQAKDNAKGRHTLGQQNLLPWPPYTPPFRLASLLDFRLMHALPRGSWFISGPHSSLQYKCGSVFSACSRWREVVSSAISHAMEIYFTLSEAPSFVTTVSAPVIWSQTSCPFKKVFLCVKPETAPQLTPLPLLCRNNNRGLFVDWFFLNFH